jgi:hypothetical protein
MLSEYEHSNSKYSAFHRGSKTIQVILIEFIGTIAANKAM